MINLKKRLDKDGESGEIMLESVIVLLLTLAILFAVFSLGFLYYQKVMIQTIANEATAYAATNYKYILSKNENEMDIDAHDITMFDYGSSGDYVPAPLKMFRSAFSVSALEREGKSDVEAYVRDRIEQSSFGINGTTKGSVTVDSYVVNVDNVGRMHIDCTVSVRCEVLFGGFLEYLELIDDSMITFSASSRAEVVDVSSYASYINFVGYVGRTLSGSLSALDDIAGSVYTVIDILTGE